MPLLNTADKVYVGAAQASAVYLGANKVWPTVSGTFTPSDLPGLGLWLSASNITATEGASVTAWTDASPAHHNATLVGSDAPTYNTALGGVPAVSFTGTDHRMQVAGFGTALSGKTAYTLFLRVQSFDNSNYPIMLTAPTYAPWTFVIEHNADAGVFWGHGNGCYRCSVPPPSPLSTWHTYSFVFAATPHFYVDGSELAIGFLGPSGDMQPMVPDGGADVLLGTYYEGSYGWNGLISDALWYDHALTDTERGQVETWLSAPHVPTLDPATSAYLAATGLDHAYAPALDGLVVGLKSHGLWTKMSAVYPMIGGTAALHKWNLLNPVDSDAAYRLTFTGGTHSGPLGYRANEEGVTANGNYADTHLVPASVLADVDSTHLAYYSLASVPPGDRTEMGCYNWDGSTTSRFHVIANYAGNFFYYGMSEAGATNTSMSFSTGLFVTTRTGATLTTAYRNGAQLDSSPQPSNSGLPTNAVWVGGIDTYVGRTDLPCGFASIGSGLTSQNVADLYTVVQNFQTALGRQI